MTYQQIMKVNCPFCNKKTIEVLYIQPMKVTKSIGAGGTKKASSYYKPSKTEILSGCQNCGKSKGEVKNMIDGKKKLPLKERLKRLKEAGLPTKIKF